MVSRCLLEGEQCIALLLAAALTHRAVGVDASVVFHSIGHKNGKRGAAIGPYGVADC